MKIDEFTEEIKKVENFYQKEYPEEQKKIIYREFKTTNIARFKYIIGQIYRTSKFLPKLADLIEINTNLGFIQEDRKNNIKCDKCNSTGYIPYIKKEEIDYQYFAVCSCGISQKYDGSKVSDKRHRSKFYIPYEAELNIRG